MFKLTYRPRPRVHPWNASGRIRQGSVRPAVGVSGNYLAGLSFGAMDDDGVPEWTPFSYAPPLFEVEDRRLFVPENDFVPRRRSGALARFQVPPYRPPPRSAPGGRFPGLLYPSAAVGFRDPSRVLVCVRRKARREVLLASGRGGGRHRAARRSAWSEVRC